MALNRTDVGTPAPGRSRPRPVLRTGGPASGIGKTPRVRSADLLGGAPEVVIEHNQREYRLRVTALGKLILTA